MHIDVVAGGLQRLTCGGMVNLPHMDWMQNLHTRLSRHCPCWKRQVYPP